MASSCSGSATSAVSRSDVAERPAELLLVRPPEVEVPLRDQGAHEREAVGVESGGGQSEDRVTGTYRAPVDQRLALHDADARPGEVERVLGHEPRVLGSLAADERAAGLSTADGHRPDELCHADRIEAADRHVVEECDGFGARTHHVVGTHRHEVDPDRVVAMQRDGDRALRADAVGRPDEDRLAVAGRDREGAAEAAEAAGAAGPVAPVRRRDRVAHQLDRPLPGCHVHARRAVCVTHGR